MSLRPGVKLCSPVWETAGNTGKRFKRLLPAGVALMLSYYDQRSHCRTNSCGPFPAFSIRLTDGRTYSGPGSDYASVSPNGRLLTIFTEGGSGVKILDVALITEIENTEAD